MATLEHYFCHRTILKAFINRQKKMNNIKLSSYLKQRKRFPSSISLFFIGAIVLGCSSTKRLNEEKATYGQGQQSEQAIGNPGTTESISTEDIGSDDHLEIRIKPVHLDLSITDSLPETVSIQGESDITPQDILRKELGVLGFFETEKGVAYKIVENYLNSNNKEPGGHCLAVSKTRFEKAYEEVHGHSLYDDLPRSMATVYYTPREVFNYLYVSASGKHKGWRSLPLKYRGKGNAGAIAYAGMGTMVDWFGIWSGKLLPGALMQVWKHRKDFKLVVRGVKKKDFDPFGHSFIFLGYVRDEKNEIIGIRIADQGYQSYRPLLPSDYEVWWAVNLTI